MAKTNPSPHGVSAPPRSEKFPEREISRALEPLEWQAAKERQATLNNKETASVNFSEAKGNALDKVAATGCANWHTENQRLPRASVLHLPGGMGLLSSVRILSKAKRRFWPERGVATRPPEKFTGG